MPRLIGAEQALELILSARPVDAKQAQELGFLDEVIEGDLRSGAIAYARSLLAAGKGPRRTGEMSVDAATATPAVFERMTAQARKLYPNRNAGLVAVDAVRAAAQHAVRSKGSSTKPRASTSASRASSRGARCTRSSPSARRAAFPGLPEDVQAAPVKSAGVIGAGTMGGGIAICFANAGIPVTLLDANAAGARARPGERRSNLSVDGRSRPADGRGQGATHGPDPHLARVRGSARGGRDHRGRVREHGPEAQDLREARPRREAWRRARDEHLDPRHRTHRGVRPRGRKTSSACISFRPRT